MISVRNKSGEGSYWSGQIGILSDGGLVLFLIWLYEKTGNEEYLKAADDAGRYIASKAEETDGGVRWQCMDSVAFGLGKNGYFPGFFYGTAGTITGLAKFFREKNPNVKIVAVQADQASRATAGPGAPTIDGIAPFGDPEFPDAFKAPFIVGFDYDECIDINGNDAYETGRELAGLDGVFLGQSAAAALTAAKQVALRPENKGKNIVVILADNGMKYLSTDMYKPDEVK